MKEDDRIQKDRNIWTNSQPFVELAYFQTIQVQKKEIASLKVSIGKLESEIEYLNHLLSLKPKLTKDEVKQLRKDELVAEHKAANVKLKKTNNQLRADISSLVYRLNKLTDSPTAPEEQ